MSELKLLEFLGLIVSYVWMGINLEVTLNALVLF
jgi:hypothetical protein